MVLVRVLRLLGCLENVLQLPPLVLLKCLFARHTLLRLLSLKLACVAIGTTSLRLRLDLLFFLEEVGVNLENVFVKVTGLQALNCDIKVRLHYRCDIALADAEVESLNIVVVAQEPVYFGLDKDVWDYRCQVIRSYLFILEERVGLSDDLHDFLELL